MFHELRCAHLVARMPEAESGIFKTVSFVKNLSCSNFQSGNLRGVEFQTSVWNCQQPTLRCGIESTTRLAQHTNQLTRQRRRRPTEASPPHSLASRQPEQRRTSTPFDTTTARLPRHPHTSTYPDSQTTFLEPLSTRPPRTPHTTTHTDPQPTPSVSRHCTSFVFAPFSS